MQKIIQNRIIGFLGAGNMGHCLIKGLIDNGYSPKCLWVCDKHQDKLDDLLQHYPTIHTTQDEQALVQNSQVLILAIKPQSVATALHSVKNVVQQYTPLLISIMAGIQSQQIYHYFDTDCADTISIIRAMPNTPALLQKGMTGLYASSSVSESNKQFAESLFQAVGQTLWVPDEKLMDVVTALSGSGPGYFFYILEAFSAAAVQLGLPESTAQQLSVQTMLGAAHMALHSPDWAKLREQVTSPGGTTQAGLNALQEGHLAQCIQQALIAATQRAQTLSQNNEKK